MTTTQKILLGCGAATILMTALVVVAAVGLYFYLKPRPPEHVTQEQVGRFRLEKLDESGRRDDHTYFSWLYRAPDGLSVRYNLQVFQTTEEAERSLRSLMEDPAMGRVVRRDPKTNRAGEEIGMRAVMQSARGDSVHFTKGPWLISLADASTGTTKALLAELEEFERGLDF